MTKRVQKGYCKFGCGRKVSPGRRLCGPHLKSEREKLRAYRAARKEAGLCWRCDNPVRPGGSLCQDHRDQVRERERELRKTAAKKTKRKRK